MWDTGPWHRPGILHIPEGFTFGRDEALQSVSKSDWDSTLNSRHETRCVLSPTSRSLVSYILLWTSSWEDSGNCSVNTHMVRICVGWCCFESSILDSPGGSNVNHKTYWCSWVVLWLSYKYRVAKVSASLLHSVYSCLHVVQAVLLAKWLQGRTSPTTRWSNSHADSSCCQSGPAFKPIWWVLYCCPAACNLCPSTHNNTVHTLFNLSYLFFTGMNRWFFTFWPLTAVFS